jgi:hypothetical protein
VSNIDAVFTTGGEPTAPATDDEHAPIGYFEAAILKAKLDQQVFPAVIASARALLVFLRHGVYLGDLVAEFHRYGFDLQGKFPAALTCEPKQLADVARQMLAAGWIDPTDELLSGIDLGT